MYKMAPSILGLYPSRGATAVYPVEKTLRKTSAVLLPSGLALMPVSKSDLSLKEIKEIYGGEIVEIDLMTEGSAPYMSNETFPKVKDRPALERAYKKWKAMMSSLSKKDK